MGFFQKGKGEGEQRRNMFKVGQIGYQAIQGHRKQKQAEGALPSNEDAEQRSALSSVRRQKRALQSGTASTQTRNTLLKALKMGMQNTFKTGGRNMTGINQLNESFGNQLNQLQQQNLAAANTLQTTENTMQDNISQRKIDLAMNKSDRLFADAAGYKRAAAANLNQYVASQSGKGENTSVTAYDGDA